MSTTKLFEDIISREIERINTESVLGGIEMETARKLEVLARAWRAYSAAKIDKEELDVREFSTEQLLAIARGETPEAGLKQDGQDKGSGQETGSGSAVEVE